MLNPVPLTVLVADRVVNAPVLPLIGVPEIVPPLIAGVAIVGDVPNNKLPDPLSSETTPASCAEVVAANCDSGFDVNAFPAPHVKPLADVHLSALPDALQLGTATTLGGAVALDALPSNEFAACGERLPGLNPPGTVNVPLTVRLAKVVPP